MNTEIKDIYNSGLKNKKFLSKIKNIEGITKPSLVSSDIEKLVFSNMYYGWLIGAYGKEWKLKMNN